MKLKPQWVYKVHVNYFIQNLFEQNANFRQNNFKAFFAFQTTRSNLHQKIIHKLEGEASYYVGGIYISKNLDALCCLFHRWNDHMF